MRQEIKSGEKIHLPPLPTRVTIRVYKLKLTTAGVPAQTGSVNEVAEHDGPRDAAEQPDDDILEADGERSLKDI